MYSPTKSQPKAVISLARIRIHKCGTVPIRWCLLCICFFVCGFIGDMGHTNVQMRKCTNSCSRLNESSASLIEITHICAMVVAQLFEVTVATLNSVSSLSRRYHRHKKQLRQSAMMAKMPSDTWVCPKCSYENQDWQQCMGPGSGMGAGCDTVKPGGIFNTSEFALSTQPPSTSSI